MEHFLAEMREPDASLSCENVFTLIIRISPSGKEQVMKNIHVILGAVGAVMLAGCASAPIALAPVGPDPTAYTGAGPTGRLVVYSAWQGHGEGNNPSFYQHADYYIYNPQGRLIRHVDNTIGHYEQVPRPVSLPAGKYVVQSWAKGFGNEWVKVPVVIRPGETTKIHLDDGWSIPSGVSPMEVVSVPHGYPVGWRAD
jgi:hypothetical protein